MDNILENINDRKLLYIAILITFLFVGLPLIILMKSEFSKSYTERTFFFTGVNTMAFVSKDDPVLNNGVEIGKVKEVFLRNDTTFVLVYILNNITIREGYSIEVISKGVMGDRSLIINTGKTDGSIVPSSNLLKGHIRIDPADALAYCKDLQKIVHKLMAISEELKNGTNYKQPLSKEINNFIAQMDTILFSFSDLTGKLNSSINSSIDTLYLLSEKISYYTNEVALSSDSTIAYIQSIVNSTALLVTKISELITKLEKIVNSINLSEDAEKVAEIKRFSKKIYSSLEKLRALLNDIQSVSPVLPVRLW